MLYFIVQPTVAICSVLMSTRWSDKIRFDILCDKAPPIWYKSKKQRPFLFVLSNGQFV